MPDRTPGNRSERFAKAGQWLRRLNLSDLPSIVRRGFEGRESNADNNVEGSALQESDEVVSGAEMSERRIGARVENIAQAVRNSELITRLKGLFWGARDVVVESSILRAIWCNTYVQRLINLVSQNKFVVLFIALAILPYLLSFSQQEIAVLLVINVLLVASYRLLTLTGEWSLGHVVIMGVGAYASALLTKRLGVPVPLAMLFGAFAAALTASVLSFPLFRMKGFYFLIGSFAAGEIIRLIWKRFTNPFGGPKGLKRIEAFPNLEIGVLKVDFYEPVNYYFLALVVVSLSLLILYRVERSRIGLTFHAIHWQDKLAESVGVNTFRYRTLAFVIASFFAGLAGALYAHYVGTVNPTRFGVDQMVYVLVWAIVGGTATFYGPILGAVVLTVINEMILRGLGLETIRPMIYGGILIASVLFLPKGLESLVERSRAWFLGRRNDGLGQ